MRHGINLRTAMVLGAAVTSLALLREGAQASTVPSNAYYGDTFTIGSGAPDSDRAGLASGAHFTTPDSPEVNNTGTSTTYIFAGSVLNDGNFSGTNYSAFQFDTALSPGSNGATNTGDLLFSNANSTDTAEQALLIKPTPLLTSNTFNTPFVISTDIAYYRTNAFVTSRAGIALGTAVPAVETTDRDTIPIRMSASPLDRRE